jgi:hypothetical protein
MWCPKEMITADGYDMQLGTNVIVSRKWTHPYLLEVVLMTEPFTGRATGYSWNS